MGSRREWLCGVLGRFYGKALVLYPAAFREEFGAEMRQFFRDDCRRTVRASGAAGLLWLGIRAVFDVARSAPGVHMEIVRQDVRFAWRMLCSAKGFTMTAVAALALGIGANGTIFSLVNGILIRPLPFPDSGRLVMIWDRNPKGIERNKVSPPNFVDYRAGTKSMAGVTAFYEDTASLLGASEPEHVTSCLVSPEFFDVLGVKPLWGAGLAGEASVPAAVLSHSLWERRFAGDPGAIGRSLRIDGREYAIRGVMPPDFRFPTRETAVWTTMPFDPARFSRQAHFLGVVGRLKPGASLAQARAELQVVAAGMAREYPASNRGWGVTAVPLQEQVVATARTSLLVFLGAVGFVLLIACANTANLLLARATQREGEMAVRMALGAGTVRLARQMVTESVLLALLGGAAGLAVTVASVAGLKVLHPASIPRLDEVTAGGWVVAFTLAMSLAAGLACGLAPAWRISRTDLNAGLKEGGPNRKSFAGHGMRGLLIMSEVALSVLLMLGAGLLMRTFLHLQRLDPGFDAGRAVTLTVDMPPVRYGGAPQRAALLEEAAARVRALPGVEAAGLISNLPLTGGEGFNRFGFRIEGRDDSAATGDYRFYARWITPGYLRGMAIPLLRGRDFSNADRDGAPPVVIVDSALASRWFPHENPVGKLLRLSYAPAEPREIVGVAREVRLLGLDTEPAPQIYIPALQEARFPTMTLVVRSALPPEAAAASARAALRGIDRNLPVYDVRPLAELVADSIAARRFRTLLMGALAALALFLAAVGVYGVMSSMAGERLREIGIRMALGARRPDILLLIVRQGMKHALAGAAGGLAAALLLTRALTGLLYGVSRLDGWSFAAAAATVLAAAFLACLVPALKAARVDPLGALRR
ncbi:MAG: ABC transporter permease [Acidobacteriia bacterium]|nr:ABC transporter permease [Terriglobia bacterium]